MESEALTARGTWWVRRQADLLSRLQAASNLLPSTRSLGVHRAAHANLARRPGSLPPSVPSLGPRSVGPLVGLGVRIQEVRELPTVLLRV